MMTYDELRALVAQECHGNECLEECHSALVANQLEAVHPTPGRSTVGATLGTFRVRASTTKSAGIPTCGFEEALDKLASMPSETVVLQFGFSSPERVFVIFVAELACSIIGCIRVSRSQLDAS